MDLVTAARERMGQFRRDDAAAAERGVADDPDVHGIGFKSVVRTSGSFTITPSAKADARERPELRVAALDQLAERRRGQSRLNSAASSGANWLA
jgi:hypothetical protein